MLKDNLKVLALKLKTVEGYKKQTTAKINALVAELDKRDTCERETTAKIVALLAELDNTKKKGAANLAEVKSSAAKHRAISNQEIQMLKDNLKVLALKLKTVEGYKKQTTAKINALVAELDKRDARVASQQAEITTLISKLESVKTTVSTLKITRSQLRDSVNRLEREAASLKEDVAKLNRKEANQRTKLVKRDAEISKLTAEIARVKRQLRAMTLLALSGAAAAWGLGKASKLKSVNVNNFLNRSKRSNIAFNAARPANTSLVPRVTSIARRVNAGSVQRVASIAPPANAGLVPQMSVGPPTNARLTKGYAPYGVPFISLALLGGYAAKRMKRSSAAPMPRNAPKQKDLTVEQWRRIVDKVDKRGNTRVTHRVPNQSRPVNTYTRLTRDSELAKKFSKLTVQ
jgi:hypothetical protein